MATSAQRLDGPMLSYVPGTAQKICQLNGDQDYEAPRSPAPTTKNRTATRGGLDFSDLGTPIVDTVHGRAWFFFADDDRMAYVDTLTLAEDRCPNLLFKYPRPDYDPNFNILTIDGEPQGSLQVPVGGVYDPATDRILLWWNTKDQFGGELPTAGASNLTVADVSDLPHFRLVRNAPRSLVSYFTTAVLIDTAKVPHVEQLPPSPNQPTGQVLLSFGSKRPWRSSDMTAAAVRLEDIDESGAWRFWNGSGWSPTGGRGGSGTAGCSFRTRSRSRARSSSSTCRSRTSRPQRRPREARLAGARRSARLNRMWTMRMLTALVAPSCALAIGSEIAAAEPAREDVATTPPNEDSPDAAELAEPTLPDAGGGAGPTRSRGPENVVPPPAQRSFGIMVGPRVSAFGPAGAAYAQKGSVGKAETRTDVSAADVFGAGLGLGLEALLRHRRVVLGLSFDHEVFSRPSRSEHLVGRVGYLHGPDGGVYLDFGLGVRWAATPDVSSYARPGRAALFGWNVEPRVGYLFHGGSWSFVPAFVVSLGRFSDVECSNCMHTTGDTMYGFIGSSLTVFFTADFGAPWSP